MWLLPIALVLWQCADKVEAFKGFDQKQSTYLLGAAGGKAWQRTGRMENGMSVDLDECDKDNYLIFIPAGSSSPSRLLWAYNPQNCPPQSFCTAHPDWCAADAINCAADTAFCRQLTDDLLYIGSWAVQSRPNDTDPTDTLLMTIGKNTVRAKIEKLTSMHATFSYQEKQPGGLIDVEEEYYHDNDNSGN